MSEPARPGEYETLKTETVYEGRVITLVKDTVAMPGGGDSVRCAERHPLRDLDNRVSF